MAAEWVGGRGAGVGGGRGGAGGGRGDPMCSNEGAPIFRVSVGTEWDQ